MLGPVRIIAGTGSASIYKESEESWPRLTKIDGTGLGSQSGRSVGISGDRVIIGAPKFRGAAFIYGLSDSMLPTKLDTDINVTVVGFGNSVAIDGDNAVVGTIEAGLAVGQAYVSRSRFGTSGWTIPEQLRSGPERKDFGKSVSLEGTS